MAETGQLILVTGAAGFIGYHLCARLLREGHHVVGIDCLDDYYDVQLKQDRLAFLTSHERFTFHHSNLSDRVQAEALFSPRSFDVVLHMAAQAGVRYSLENPHAYVDSNLVGFLNVMEASRQVQVGHFVYASSSSVYGDSDTERSRVGDSADRPISLYAATKRANELMAYSYSHLYDLPTTGLRFFTVYGPWGRPDMAIYKFAESIWENRPIDVFNQGRMKRSFTYIDDVVEGVVRLADHIPKRVGEEAPYRLYNIGNDQSVELETMISLLEKALGKKAVRNYQPLQQGDVKQTCADIRDLREAVGYSPSTTLEEGIAQFAGWYLWYREERSKQQDAVE